MFSLNFANTCSDGKLIYRIKDQSFDTIEHNASGVASILINDINIEFSEDKLAVAVWGLSAMSTWKRAKVLEPDDRTGWLEINEDLLPGISVRITPINKYWPVTHDPNSGWIRIGKEETKFQQVIKFLPDCVVGFENDKICTLWLHPNFQ